MAIIFDSVKPLSVRVPTVVSQQKDLQLWDIDNLYPQRCEEAISRSYTLKSLLDSVADFLAGEGFEDQAIGNLIVNDAGLNGETLNKVLRKVTKGTYSKYNSIALHIGYDMNFRISSINYVPIDFIRFPTPEEDGSFDFVWYCTNWEADRHKEVSKQPTVTAYRTFNCDPSVIEGQIAEAGGIEFYRGQILLMTPDYFQYPKATFDPIIDHAQTQAEIGMFKLGYTQNGFMATMAILYRGEFESADEKKEFQALVKRKTGARNANTNIGLQDKTGTLKISDMFQSIQPQNLDKLFELTETSAINSILENEGWPKILLGIQAQGTLFNQESLVDAYTYANAKTRNRRSDISELFSLLLKHWSTPIETSAKIKEKQYVYAQAAPTPGVRVDATGNALPAQEQGQETSLTDKIPDSPRLNQTLTNLTGRQSQGVDRILRKVQSGKYTQGIARLMLKLSVGLSDSDIDEMFADLINDEQTQ